MRDIYHLYVHKDCFNENSWIIYGKLGADKIVDNLCYICKKINQIIYKINKSIFINKIFILNKFKNKKFIYFFFS